jgi:hypothetical protein
MTAQADAHLVGTCDQLAKVPHQVVDTGVSLDTFNGRRIGAALVNGDLLGHTVQVDGTLQKAPRCCLVPLGREKKVHRLGHESMSTTNQYVEADLAMKEKVLACLQDPDTKMHRFVPPDALMQFLQSL